MCNSWDNYNVGIVLFRLDYHTMNMHNETWKQHDLTELNGYVLDVVLRIENKEDQEAAFQLLCEAVEKVEKYDDGYSLPY